MCNHSAHLPASVPTSKKITEYLLLATNSLWLSNDVGLFPAEVLWCNKNSNVSPDGVDRLICYGQRGNDAVPKSKDWCSMLSQLCLNGARHPKDGSTEQMANAKAIVSI